MQESNKSTEAKTRGEGRSDGTDALHQIDYTDPERLDSMSVDFDLEPGFDVTFADDFGLTDISLDPNLASLIHSMNAAHDEKSAEDQLDALSAQVNASYHAPQFENTDHSTGDSGYATGTSSSSPVDPNLTSPHSTIFIGGEPMPLATCSNPKPVRCSCLRQQVQLVYQLEELQYSHAGVPSVDSALKGVQLAQKPWRGLMQCSWCQGQDGQKEVLLLFAMSIRILLSVVQKLDASVRHADVSLHKAAMGVRVSVGSFELTGEAKAEVISMAIRKALQNIKSALLHIWERTGRPRLPTASVASSSSSGRSSSNGSRSALSILTSNSADPQKSTNQNAEDIKAFLSILQRIVQVLQKNSGARAERSWA
ncbi:hypothetical protein AAE478_003200 [Parahypoxylon ruwenzoriense]